MALVVDEHRHYLADQARLSAFHRAIGEVVKPGDVVLDLGAGTGILGLLACRAGASRVYSIESSPLIDLTRDICRINGYSDRVQFINDLSTQVKLPEKVDAVVADQIGEFGFDAGILEYFADARERFLKPDGLMIFQDSSSGLGNFTRGGPRIKYDPRKFRAIGSVNRGGSILMVRKDARARMMDPKGQKLVVGDTDGIRTWVSMSVWSAEYLGWNLRYLYGYPGSRELALAFRQGEIDMWGTQSARLIKELQKDGIVDLLVQQDEERRPDFPDVPTFDELLGNKRPSGVSWEAYQEWAGPEEIDKFLLAPAGTPDNIVAMLREAYVKMGKDETFAKQANSFYGEAWRVRPGEWSQAKIKEVTTISKEARDFLQQIRKKYGLPVGN